ncbi:hypothetical protein [Candidatus Viridilinea mediisalina]|uniref:hypothetical protein n=1 Tax=Candidatus Viridilinea mediisalina TaxID=2024553 RepID=UPI000F5A8507|nr:hypothetical protein [Candidatus Viridilinea mediisalina]
MRRRIPQQVVIHVIALLALFVGLIPPTTPSSVGAAPAQVRANRIVPTPTLPSPQLAVAQAVSTPNYCGSTTACRCRRYGLYSVGCCPGGTAISTRPAYT